MTPLGSTAKPAAGPPTAACACTTCGAELRPDANFCRACGAAQTAATLPLAAEHLWVPDAGPGNPAAAPEQAPAVRAIPAGRAEPSGITAASQPPRSDAPRERRSRKSFAISLVAAVALAAAALVVILIVLPNRRADELDGQLRQIAAGATRSIESLNQATSSSGPEDAASLVALRAAAARSVDHLGNAQTDLRALKLDGTRNSVEVGGLKDSLAELKAVARVLARRTLVANTIAGLSAQANRSVGQPGELRLPEVKTDQLVAALQARDRALEARAHAKRLRARAARRRRSQAAADSAPQRSTSTPAAFRLHTGLGYQAELPSGAGWSTPADSQPTAGLLLRTTVRGPGGTVVIIDYTPREPATFGGSFQSRRDVGQTAFGAATEYVFQGGSLPECQRARCVDYIINDRRSGSGFGVLAGGPDFQLSQQIGRTVMESLTAAPA